MSPLPLSRLFRTKWAATGAEKNARNASPQPPVLAPRYLKIDDKIVTVEEGS